MKSACCVVHRNRPLSLSDLKRVLQSSGLQEGRVFPEGMVDLEEGDALRLIPTAVRLLTERASHGDWNLRSSWLSHLGKSYQHIPGAQWDGLRFFCSSCNHRPIQTQTIV